MTKWELIKQLRDEHTATFPDTWGFYISKGVLDTHLCLDGDFSAVELRWLADKMDELGITEGGEDGEV